MCDSAFWRLIIIIKMKIKIKNQSLMLYQIYSKKIRIYIRRMGVATTTDTTDSVRTSFEVFKNLYGMSVQVDETAKSKKEGKAAVCENIVKATPE